MKMDMPRIVDVGAKDHLEDQITELEGRIQQQEQTIKNLWCLQEKAQDLKAENERLNDSVNRLEESYRRAILRNADLRETIKALEKDHDSLATRREEMLTIFESLWVGSGPAEVEHDRKQVGHIIVSKTTVKPIGDHQP
jgi:predicted nuclease with TOPRIM domain